MKKQKFFIIILCIIFLIACSKEDKNISMLCSTIELEPLKTVNIDMELYYPKKYLKSISNIEVNDPFFKVSKENNNLKITSLKTNTGYFSILIKLEGIPKKNFLINIKQKPIGQDILFKYKDKKDLDVFVAGDFNGWNSSKDKLSYTNGEYKTTIKIPNGTYKYKFVVNGNWICDPENKNKLSDGFGGFNSIITIGPTIHYKPIKIIPLTKDIAESSINELFLSFKIKKAPEQKISKLILTANNYIVDPKLIKIEKDTIRVLIDTRKYDINKYKETKFKLFIQDNYSLMSPEYGFTVYNDQILISYVSNEQFIKDNWRDSIIYFLFIDRFFNGDKSNDSPILGSDIDPRCNFNGGDFRGIIKKIKDGYFTNLGINTLWISPVVKNPNKAYKDINPPHKFFTGYHGYWPIDNYTTDPHFGTIKELKELISEAHKRNIKVLLDFVANHVHKDNKLYKKHKNWFGSLIVNGETNIRKFDKYPFTTWFDTFLPAFDYEKREAREYMIKNALFWIDMGIDGFRQDAVKHIPPIFWKELTKKIRLEYEFKTGKRFYQIGETISGRKTISKFIGDDMLPGQFDFPLYWAIRSCFAQNGDFNWLNSEIEKSYKEYPANSDMSIFIGNHDFARFASFADGDLIIDKSDTVKAAWENPPETDTIEAYIKTLMAFAFIMTQNGIPMIYYGDEIAMAGAHDPDNRRMMKFKKNIKELVLFTYLKTLTKFRKKHLSTRYGTYTPLHVSEKLLAYEKDYFNDHIIVIFNKDTKIRKLTLKLEVPEDEYIEYYTGMSIKPINSKISIRIKPYSFLLFQTKLN